MTEHNLYQITEQQAQNIHEILSDCDGDLIINVLQRGTRNDNFDYLFRKNKEFTR